MRAAGCRGSRPSFCSTSRAFVRFVRRRRSPFTLAWLHFPLSLCLVPWQGSSSGERSERMHPRDLQDLGATAPDSLTATGWAAKLTSPLKSHIPVDPPLTGHKLLPAGVLSPGVFTPGKILRWLFFGSMCLVCCRSFSQCHFCKSPRM